MSNAPCHLWICSATNWRSYYNNGYLTLTNAAVSAWLRTLEIGTTRYTGTYDWGTDGRLDLSASALDAFSVTGHVWVGSAPFAAFNSILSNKRGKGRLLLPAGKVVIGGNLLVGDTNSAEYSYGQLDLSGTTVEISGRLLVNNSGIVTARLAGVSAGIDVKSADTNNLGVGGNGLIRLVFDVEPADWGDEYRGLRIEGNQTGYLQSLADAGRLAWITNALDPRLLKRFGIHFNEPKNYSFVGLKKLTIPGVVIAIR